MQVTNNTNTTDVALLNPGDFFAHNQAFGQIVSISRPRTVDLFTTPTTRWDIEYVDLPDDDAPVYRVRIPAGTTVETWT